MPISSIRLIFTNNYKQWVDFLKFFLNFAVSSCLMLCCHCHGCKEEGVGRVLITLAFAWSTCLPTHRNFTTFYQQKSRQQGNNRCSLEYVKGCTWSYSAWAFCMLLDLISQGVLRSQCAARAVEYGLPPILLEWLMICIAFYLSHLWS